MDLRSGLTRDCKTDAQACGEGRTAFNAGMQRAGRPRRYHLEPASGIADAGLAKRLAWIEELTARTLDITDDIDEDTLNHIPEGGSNSIALLVCHMCAAELHWLQSFGTAPDADLQWISDQGLQAADGEIAAHRIAADQLRFAVANTRAWTRRAVARISDPTAIVPAGDKDLNGYGVLDHLGWHWAYHTGQIGLLRRLFGPRYQWRFDSRLTAD